MILVQRSENAVQPYCRILTPSHTPSRQGIKCLKHAAVWVEQRLQEVMEKVIDSVLIPELSTRNAKYGPDVSTKALR